MKHDFLNLAKRAGLWRALLSVTFVLTGWVAGLTTGAAQAAAISAEMLQEAQRMSPREQEALAKQFGFDRAQIQGGGATTPQLATPAAPLTQQKPLEEKIEEKIKEPISEAQKAGDSRFGADLFDQAVSSFAVTDNALVPKDYRLGIGDEVLIMLYGKETSDYLLEIGRSGEIQLPKIGPLVLAGLQFEDARDLIQRQVKERLIGIDAMVSMGRMRAISVFMAGEVRVPGSYSVSALATVSQALFAAGGVSPIGTLRQIQVKRAGETIAVFDTYDLLLRGEVAQDVRLQSGDVVFVPPYDRLVIVEGEVKRPMTYELADSETAENLVAMAGGYGQAAYPAAAVLKRKAQGKNLPTVLNLDLTVAEGSVELLDGDTLRIPRAADTYANAIEVQGAVVRPGIYAWAEGLRVSDLLPSVRSDLLPTVDVMYALIVREKNSRLDIEVKQFDLGAALLSPGSPEDPILFPRDKVLVFELPGLSDAVTEGRQALLAPVLTKLRAQAAQGEPVQIVSLSGAVKAPGDYPIVNGDRVYDLLRAGGGLQDSVYLPAAELRRIVSQGEGQVESQYEELSLEYLDDADNVNNQLLQSRDHLMVRRTPDWNPTAAITVAGEVRFPGEYLIRRGETLSQIVARAGGLTADAFPEGAVFTRLEIARLEKERATEFAQSIKNSFAASLLTQEQKSSDFAEIQSITQTLADSQGQGRVLVNLSGALTGDTSVDMIVVAGDKLVIPPKSNTINVVGEVRRQGTLSYQRNLELKDYVTLAAGMTARADKKEIYIVKANGSVVIPETSWLMFGSAQQQLAPGDSIIVPVNSKYKDTITQWRDVTQILYQGAVTVAAVIAL